jgi:hypothetical protein
MHVDKYISVHHIDNAIPPDTLSRFRFQSIQVRTLGVRGISG